MERREDSFYTAYSYGDKLEEGHKLTLEHHISFDQRHADLSALTWMPLDRLQALRSKSVETEKAVFRDLQEATKHWEEQAAQTMIQKKRYGGFAAARRRVYAAGSDPPALCGELRKEETALCGQ